MRARAIFCALWFGVMPWWVYERKRHYEESWWRHLVSNLHLAARWATFRENEEDRVFEHETNVPGRINWTRWHGAER